MSSDSGPLSPRNVTPCVPVLIEKSGHLQFKQGKAHFFPLILISGSALSPLACQVVVSLMVSSVMGFWSLLVNEIQDVLRLLVQIQFKVLPSSGAKLTLGRSRWSWICFCQIPCV